MDLAIKNLKDKLYNKASTSLNTSSKEISNNTKTLEKHNEKNYLNTLSLAFYLVNISLDFSMFAYLHAGIPSLYNLVPYAFRTENLLSVLALELKEFTSNPHNTIKICQHCKKYYIPRNLKATKYCQKCRNIGKQTTYKKALSKNDVLKLYRKRYMSLASSVSHYGTPKAIEKFETYKKDGAVMKEKYLNKEISRKEFKKWIEESKK